MEPHMKTTRHLALERRSPIRHEGNTNAHCAGSETGAPATDSGARTAESAFSWLKMQGLADKAVRAPWLASLLLCVFALLPLAARAATNDLSAALQTGLFEEEANRNLPAAIEAYEQVAKQFDQNRALAATAIFRLGEVNRKLGRTNEAAAFYQRILREFSDQDTLAKLSQQNLAGMGVTSENAPSPASGKGYSYVVQAGDTLSKIVAGYRAAGVDVSAESVLAANPGLNATRLRVGQTIFIPAEPNARAADVADLAALHAAEAEVATLGEEVDRLQAMSPEDRQRTIEQNYTNPVLTKLLQDLATAEQRLVVLSKDYSPNHPEVANGKTLVDTIRKQIDTQLGNVLIGLREKRFAAAARMKVLREQMDQSAIAQSVKPGDTAPITTVPDEEETEIRRIQAMIQNSPDLINALGDGGTPLYRSASKGQLRVTAFLLDHGGDVNLKSGGQTALHAAAAAGHKSMVELLLNRGANVDARTGGNETPLYLAAEHGYKAVAEVLLAHKADVNARASARTNDGRTPLHRAAESDDLEMIGLLLANGAEVNAADARGWTPLITAAIRRQNSKAIAALIAAQAQVDATDNEGRTALSYAAELGDEENVKALLAAKADPNAGKVNLPLHCAIKAKSPAIVEALLKAGADANSVCQVTWRLQTSGYYFPNGTETTPLALAVADGRDAQPEVVKLLLANKANPNGKNLTGGLLIFSVLNNAELTRALLDAGANPNVLENTPDNARTPLITASDPKVISLLLAAGADPEARLSGYPALMLFVDSGNKPAVEALMKGGANINAKGRDGSTALHLATKKGDTEMIKLLIAHKADVNARDNQGLTPLDYATGKTQANVPGGTLVLNGPPISYQWGTGQSDAKTETTSVADLLRQHGGLADLPKLDRIELVRPGSFQNVVFYKSTNDWNRFTLLEVILNNYRRQPPRGLGGGTAFSDRLAALTNPSSTSPPFPDLHRIVVIRQQPASSSKPAERITVDLLNATNGVDCAKDITLNFGDVVEIPERLHTLQEPAVGLTSVEMAQMWACRIGVVTLIYQGKKTSLQVAGTPAEALIDSILAGEEARKALFSSADLTRVKVTRRESANAKPRVWIVDCSNQDKAPDLWLRDGDVIEVPEK